MKKTVDAFYALILIIGFPLIMLAYLNGAPSLTSKVENTSGIEINHAGPVTLPGMNTFLSIVKD